MKQRFKPYTEYQQSGVAWIGEMPNHWGLQRTKTFFERMQRPIRPQDGIVTAFRDGEVTLRSNRRTDGFTNAAKEIGYQGVRVDDLVVHAMDGFAGAIGVSDSDGKCSPVYSVCTPKQIDKVDVAYYGYLVRQLAVTDFISSLAKGIRERSTEFRYSEFSILELAVPPKEEQKQIAAFLDYETAKIDTLIEKQQQLIALLGEKRQVVISHAVTKGLNADAPMRDSGVEWLGEVPEHWEEYPLKVLLGLKHGYPFDSADFSNEGEFILMTPGNFIQRGGFRPKVPEKYFNGSGFPKEFILEEGQLLVAMTEQGPGLLGCALFVPSEGTYLHNQRLGLVHGLCTERLNERFLFHLFNSCRYRAEASVTSTGAKVQHTSPKKMLSVKVWLPPLAEQERITSFVDERIAKLESLEEKADETVELLHERRTALISAAVTGKIDVRGWKPPPFDVELGTEMEVA